MSWLVFCITKLEVREVGCLPVQQWLLICEIGTCDRICAELHVVQKLPQLSPSVSGQFQEQSVFILVNISSTKQLYVIIKSYIGLRKECAILDILKLQLLVCHLLILLLNYTKFPFKVLGSWIRFFPPMWNLLLSLFVPKAADVTELIIIIRVKNYSFSHWNVLALMVWLQDQSSRANACSYHTVVEGHSTAYTDAQDICCNLEGHCSVDRGIYLLFLFVLVFVPLNLEPGWKQGQGIRLMMAGLWRVRTIKSKLLWSDLVDSSRKRQKWPCFLLMGLVNLWQAGYAAIGCTLILLCLLSEAKIVTQSLRSQELHHFSCLTVKCRERMKQRMNMPFFIAITLKYLGGMLVGHRRGCKPSPHLTDKLVLHLFVPSKSVAKLAVAKPEGEDAVVLVSYILHLTRSQASSGTATIHQVFSGYCWAAFVKEMISSSDFSPELSAWVHTTNHTWLHVFRAAVMQSALPGGARCR